MSWLNTDELAAAVAADEADDRPDMVTLHGRAEGCDTFPMFCGPKDDTLDWAQRLEAARILVPGTEWTPCCRDRYANVACALDMFSDPDDDLARQVILLAANNTPNHHTSPPEGIIS